jgi:hypothetical protein
VEFHACNPPISDYHCHCGQTSMAFIGFRFAQDRAGNCPKWFARPCEPAFDFGLDALKVKYLSAQGTDQVEGRPRVTVGAQLEPFIGGIGVTVKEPSSGLQCGR